MGELSGLVIGPSGSAYTVTSSDPDTVEVEQVMNFWTAVAKAEGERGDHRLQPGRGNRDPDADRWHQCPAGSPPPRDSPDQGERCRMCGWSWCGWSMRRAGRTVVAELPVSEALMSCRPNHLRQEVHLAPHAGGMRGGPLACGYPYGFGVNLLCLPALPRRTPPNTPWTTGSTPPAILETMMKPDCDSIGVGVTESGGVTYCYLFVGRPNTHNPYE